MFSIFKRSSSSTDLSWLQTDMHSHLLPGIDDGSPDTTTSLELIKGMMELGYRKLITTPHVLWEMYPNSGNDIINKMGELRNDAKELDVELGAAAEYFIDDHFAEELYKKEPLLTLSGNMVLVEFSMVTQPLELQEVLFEMQMQNYQPVIAHPERYIYLAGKKSFFDELKDAGCYFQLNLLSVAGHYGRSVQELAEYLVKKNYYELAGTDLHHQRHLAALRKLGKNSLLQKLRDSGNMKNQMI